MPSVPATPRTTRNSRGLRRSSVEPIGSEKTPSRGLATRRRSPRPRPAPYPTTSPGRTSPTSSALAANTSPTPAEAGRATSSAANAPSQDRANLTSPETPPALAPHTVLQSIAEERSLPTTPLRTPVTRFQQQQRARDQSVERSPFGIDFNFTASPVIQIDRGYESTSFMRRRALVGEEKFARELHMAIRNDHFMRQCCCGLPPIYNSLQDAKRGAGHLRFYTVDSKKNNLRVIQVNIDDRWHCYCAKSKILDWVYQQHIAKGRKRRATDSEFDLIAQNQATEIGDSSSIERNVHGLETISEGQPNEADSPIENAIPTEEAAQPSAIDQSPVAEASVESAQTVSSQPMWSYITGGLVTMGASVLDLVGKLIPSFSTRRTTVENVPAVETVQQDPVTNQLSVKRYKREHVYSSTSPSSPADVLSDSPRVEWASDPAARIGLHHIKPIHESLGEQLRNLQAENFAVGPHWSQLAPHFTREDVDSNLSTIISRMVYEDNSVLELDNEEVEAKARLAAAYHEENLQDLMTFIEGMYFEPEQFEQHRHSMPEPTLPFRVGNITWRRIAGNAARLLAYFLREREIVGVDELIAELLAKILADAKAVHKQEFPPSWIKFTGVTRQGVPLPPSSVFEYIPIDEFHVDAPHDVKYPEPSRTLPVSQADPRAVKRLKFGPKPVLKKSPKDWPTPPSPQYVATPEKPRKLGFRNPAVTYGGPPSHIPAKVMTPWERYIEYKPQYNEKALAIAEEKFKLQYLGANYNPLLNGLREGIEKRKAARQAKWDHHKPDTSIYMMSEEAKAARRRRDAKMKEQFELKKKWRTKLAAIRDKQPNTPQHKVPERLVIQDTPEEIRKTKDEGPIIRQKQERPSAARLAEQGQKLPMSAEERRKALDRALLGPGGDQKKTEYPPDPFEEHYDELDIAQKQMEHLQIHHQIKTDWGAAILRSRREAEEEAARKKEEAKQKRLEEERRRKEEERLKAVAEAAARSGLRRPSAPLITEISEKWEDEVSAIGSQHPSAPICKTPDGTSLFRRDFAERLLPKTAWLNDNIMVGSFDHIARYVNDKAGAVQKVNPKCSAFSSFFYERLLSHGINSCGRMARMVGIKKANFFDIETILIPICQNSHWTLAVVRPQRRTITHIDSMLAGRGHAKVKNTILAWVKVTLEERFVEADWKFEDIEAPLQTNGYDCGVFTITNGICLALGVNPMDAYTADQLELQRSWLAAMLINEGFTGDFSLDHI